MVSVVSAIGGICILDAKRLHVWFGLFLVKVVRNLYLCECWNMVEGAGSEVQIGVYNTKGSIIILLKQH